MFDNINFFRKLIIFQVLLIIPIILVYVYLKPEESSNDASYETFSTIQQISSFIVLGLIPLYFFILYKLYNFKPIGKTLLIPVLVLFEIISFTSFSSEGSSNSTYISDFLDYVDYFVVGMIVTFVYFTDINKEFDK